MVWVWLGVSRCAKIVFAENSIKRSTDSRKMICWSVCFKSTGIVLSVSKTILQQVGETIQRQGLLLDDFLGFLCEWQVSCWGPWLFDLVCGGVIIFVSLQSLKG